MPHAIAVAALAVKTAAETAFVTAIGGSTFAVPGSYAIATAIGATAFYGTEALVYTALSAGAAAAVPDPEAGQTTLKQPLFARRRAYGRVRLAPPGYFLWTAKGNEAGQVGPLCEGPVDGFEQMYLFDQKVEYADGAIPNAIEGLPDGSYPYPFVKIYTREGLFSETAYGALVTLFPDEWTSAHRGDGIATLAMTAGHGKQDEFQGRYPGGEPQPSIVVRAALVFDPRDEVQTENDDPQAPTTWTWSDNPALCLMNYEMVHERRCFTDAKDEDGKAILIWNQAGWDRYFAPRLQMWKDAADVCDEAVALAAGGTVKRYTVGGFFDETNAADSARKALIDSFDGWQGQDGNGGLTIYAGKFYTPTATLGDDDILDCQVQRFEFEERAVNQVIATYTEPSTDYTTVECLPWRNEADITATGKEKTDALALPWVQNNSQARRLAKRRLALLNPLAQGSIRCDMTDAALDALGQRYVTLQCSDSPTLADGIPIQIMRAEIDLMDMAITYYWIAADPDIDDWDAETDETDAPYGPERPAPEALDVPTIDSIEVFFDSGGLPRLRVTATGPDRDDLSWGIGTKTPLATAFNEEWLADLDPSTPVLMESGIVPQDSLKVIAFYQTGGGTVVRMEDVDAVSVDTYAVEAPGDPTDVMAELVGSDVLVSWVNPSNLYFSSLRVFRSATADFDDATDVSGALLKTGVGAPQSWTDTAPASGIWYYWVVAYTSLPLAGDPAGPAIVTVYETETIAILAAFTTPADDTRAGLIDSLIASLKSAGIWSKLDLLYVRAAADSQAARINWAEPGVNTSSVVGSVTFTADRGFAGDGSTGYLESGRALNALAHGTQNSLCFGTWVLDNATGTQTMSAGTRFVNPRNVSNQVVFSGDGASLTETMADSRGLTVANRSGASAREIYKNGAFVKADTTASTALAADTFWTLRYSGNYSSHQVAVDFVSSSLDATEQAALYNAVNDYLTAVGAI